MSMGTTRAVERAGRGGGNSNFHSSTLFEPDTLLPAQFAARRGAATELPPEQKLMLAIIELVVGDFQKYCGRTEPKAIHRVAEAQRWIWGDGRRWPFSVRNVCDVLGIDVDWLRAGLERWREQHGAADRTPPPRAPLPETADGRRVRRVLQAAGWRHRDLADRLGIGASNISDVARGSRPLSQRALRLLRNVEAELGLVEDDDA